MKYNVLVSVSMNGFVEVESTSKEEAEEEAARIFDIGNLGINSIEANAQIKKEARENK
jgi:hypothetical protein